jgi:hypothetical protein
MQKRYISIGVALIITTIFLLLVLSSGGSAFNFFPYLIHESISKGGAGEAMFITIFDIVFGIIIFWIAYLVLNRFLKD